MQQLPRMTLAPSFLWIVACGAVPPAGNGDGSSSTGDAPDPSATATTATTDTPATTTTGVDPAEDSSSGTDESTGVGTFEGSSEAGTETGGIEACDPFGPDCPEGFKCMPYAEDGGGTWTANGCFPVVDDPAGIGEPCEPIGSPTSGEDTCDAGAMCWGVSQQVPTGECAAQCEGTPDDPTCPEGTSCIIVNGGVVAVCVPGCDPLAQDCGQGQGCYPVGGGFTCAVVGVPAGQGDECGFANGCAAGLMCMTPTLVPGCDGVACCTGFCALDDVPGPCAEIAEGTECAPFYEPGQAPSGLENVGVCVAL